MRKIRTLFAVVIASMLLCCGCHPDRPDDIAHVIDLEDGTYLVDFNTDSSMFHVNETKEGKGILTVANNQGTIHIVLVSKNIEKLYLGLAEDAENDSKNLIMPVSETVTYDDQTTEEVFAFDVPVPYLYDEFDLALIGTKGVWYDHKVSVSNPEPYQEEEAQAPEVAEESPSEVVLAEGENMVLVTLEGGSGKATVDSPTKLVVREDGSMVATITWSSPHYDYMIVDGEKYLPINEDGNSVFEIPVKELGTPMPVIADTVAMSEPHEIEYTLLFEIEK